MVNMTLAIPKDMHEKMRLHSEVKWAEIARRAFAVKIKSLDEADKESKFLREYAYRKLVKE
jgi:hypothetical protein